MKKFAKFIALGIVGLSIASCRSGGQLTYEETLEKAKAFDGTNFDQKDAVHKGKLEVTNRTENTEEDDKDAKIKDFLLDLKYKDEFRYHTDTKASEVVTFQDSYTVEYTFEARTTSLNVLFYYLSPEFVTDIHTTANMLGYEEVYTENNGEVTTSLVYSLSGQKTSTEKYTYGYAREITYVFAAEGNLKTAKSIGAYTVVNQDNAVDFQFVIESNYEVELSL